MAVTLISSKKSSSGSPYAYYTMTASASNRTASSVKITITAKGHLQYAESVLGTGHTLVAGVYCGGSWHTATLKSSSSVWSGTSSHSKTWSFTVNVSSSATSVNITQVRVLNTGSGSQSQLNATTVNKAISFSAYSVATVPKITEQSAVLNTGNQLHISLNPQSTAYAHTLFFSFGSYTETIATSSKNTSFTYTLSDSLTEYITDSSEGTATITCKTYNGTTLVGTKTDTVILEVPSYTVPKPTITVVNESGYAFFLANTTAVRVNTNTSSWSGTYYSTLAGTSIYIENNSTGERKVFQQNEKLAAGYYKFIAINTDSRGNQSEEAVSSVYESRTYTIPEVTVEEASFENNAFYITVNTAFTIAPTLTILYRKMGDSGDYVTFYSQNLSSQGTIRAERTLTQAQADFSGVNENTLWEYKVIIADKANAPYVIYKQGKIVLSRRKDGIAFGKKATQAGLECDYEAQFNKPVNLKGALTSDANATFGGDIKANRALINGDCYVNNHVNPIGYTLSGSNTVNITSGTTGKALGNEISLGAGTWVCIGNVRYKSMGGKTALVQWYVDTPDTSGYEAIGVARNQAAAPADLGIQCTLIYQCDAPFKARIYGWQNSGSTLKDVSVYWRAVRIA